MPLKITEPWNNEFFDEIKTHNASEIENILIRGEKLASYKGYNFTIIQRIEVLNKFANAIKSNKDFLAKQASKEGGKPLVDSMIEIKRAADGVETCIEVLKSDTGNVIPMNIDKASKNRIAFTKKEPIGLVLAISAFNHPFNLIIHQVIPALAAGCPVIVKPAEDTPLSCLTIIKMLHESGLPENWCQFVMPEKIELATKLVGDHRISFLSFIGSSKVGWFLRSKLSPGTKCSLEHGGMAPIFLESDTNINLAVKSVARGGYYHAGQVCVSIQRLFINKSIYKDFIERLKTEVESLVVDNPLDMKTFLGPLIRPKEVDRVENWVNEAVSNGAKIISGGNRISKTCYKPTILTNTSEKDKISQNEVFGPVVCVHEYEEIENAIKNANSVNVSFQAAIFTNKINSILNFFNNINASTVLHNDHTAFRVDWMPFSGLKHSGHGIGGIKYTMHDMQIEKMLILREE